MTPLPSLLNVDLARARARIPDRRGAGPRLVRRIADRDAGPSTRGRRILPR
jgi:hypothetical protein